LPQLKEATADNTTDVLLHRQLIVKVDADISFEISFEILLYRKSLSDSLVPSQSKRSSLDKLYIVFC